MNDKEYESIRPNNRDQYGLPFFKFADQDHGPSNLLFGHVLWHLFHPRSVIDFGCGTAGALSTLKTYGADVLGVDGFAACLPLIERRDPSLVPHIQIHDLCKPWSLPAGVVYSLATCIECLEHLPESAADIAVTSIARSAQRVIISTPPPSPGSNPNELHLNEQPIGYWIDKFAANGMKVDAIASRSVRAVMRAYTDAFDGSGQALSCLVPAWFFSSYLEAFTR